MGEVSSDGDGLDAVTADWFDRLRALRLRFQMVVSRMRCARAKWAG
ncbi:MAG: hypothetical protein HMLKMBBP_01251 [Planctomycetes bacterium]|nr:hypothetical protein [Planctomycetota bacterium]